MASIRAPGLRHFSQDHLGLRARPRIIQIQSIGWRKKSAQLTIAFHQSAQLGRHHRRRALQGAVCSRPRSVAAAPACRGPTRGRAAQRRPARRVRSRPQGARPRVTVLVRERNALLQELLPRALAAIISLAGEPQEMQAVRLELKLGQHHTPPIPHRWRQVIRRRFWPLGPGWGRIEGGRHEVKLGLPAAVLHGGFF